MKTAFLALPALFFGSAVFACNAQIAQILGSEDAGAPQDGGSADGPVVIEVDASRPTRPDTGADASTSIDSGVVACTKDHECNFDLAMSSLAGSCFQGVCICKVGYYVQPNGKCGAQEPPSCTTVGGTCRKNPAECQAGELDAHYYSTMSCGDIMPAQCCIPAASCYAPIDIVCCGAAADYYEPTCVNGWRTCASGAPTPRLRSQGCP
jgi:hypothetical protein